MANPEKHLSCDIERLEQLANEGDAEAQLYVGYYCLNGIQTTKDLEKAKQWLNQASQSQDQAGLCAKGVLCEARKKELNEKIKRIQISYSKLKSNSEEYKQCIEEYEQSTEEAKQCSNEAEQCYQQASDLQYPFGQYLLAEFRTAVSGYIPPREFELYQSAVEKGGVLAINQMGYFYNNHYCYSFSGLKIRKKQSEAFKWYLKAAQMGLAEAQWRVGECYDLADGVKRNHEEAARWFALAANQGYRQAMFSLALSYGRGAGVPKDIVQAAMWMLKAQALGHKRSRELIEKGQFTNKVLDAAQEFIDKENKLAVDEDDEIQVADGASRGKSQAGASGIDYRCTIFGGNSGETPEQLKVKRQKQEISPDDLAVVADGRQPSPKHSS